MLQPELGLAGASAMWSALFAAAIGLSARGSPRWDNALSFGVGMNLGAAAIHFLLWPWTLRKGVPVLTEAEGLKEDDLRAYNVLLNVWALLGLAAVFTEVPSGSRRWAAAGFFATLPLMKHARFHFEWLKGQAQSNPAWWNRALQDEGSRGGESNP